MRFYKITTTKHQKQIDEIIMSMSSTEVDYVSTLYNKISMVEFTDEKEYECMFAILDKYLLNKISELYLKYSIDHKIFDLTKDIIFDNNLKLSYKNYRNQPVKNEVLKLIKLFKKDWTTKDDVLDKILEKGINSLSDFDLEILNS